MNCFHVKVVVVYSIQKALDRKPEILVSGKTVVGYIGKFIVLFSLKKNKKIQK